MNKTAIKNFSIWARNKLIADVSYRAGLMGITANGIDKPLPQSTGTAEFYDIGTAEPYSISGEAVSQRRRLVEAIRTKERDSDYQTAYKYIVEEVAYTWFNRLIAIRFMEVNDYLPSHIRVLSSETGKMEPDLVTTPFDADLDFTKDENGAILQMQLDNDVDGLFHLLFIKQCNALNAILPGLFEKTDDFTELLLNLSVIDKEGVVYRLVHDIDEDDFNIEKGGQVEIIGWLYQYWNTEPKAAVFGRPSGTKIKKEEIPAATQLFTPRWIVRYMVENSLGRLWVEGHPNDELKAKWAYYLEEAEQEPDIQAQLVEIRKEYSVLKPEDIKCIDPCMGSGHILCCLFDVLMQIYESQGYSQRDAAQSIVRHNLYGLDIDKRATQLAYFSVMMKARQYDRRFLTRGIEPNVYEVQESGWTGGKYPFEMGNFLLSKEHQDTLNYLLEAFREAKGYGSLLRLEQRDYAGLLDAWQYTASQTAENVNMLLWYSAVEEIVPVLIKQAIVLTQKYHVVVTNPPYMGSSGMNGGLAEYVKKNHPDAKADLFACFIERGNQIVKKNGFNCMVTMQSWMFLSSFEKMRENILYTRDITNLMHMENMVMGIAFGTAVTVFKNSHTKGYKGTYNYVKLSDIENDVPKSFPVSENRFAQISTDNFSNIPGSPVAYWLKKHSIFDFGKLADILTSGGRIKTHNNDLYVKNWWEIIKNNNKWIPYANGGEFRKWYGDHFNVVDWSESARSFYAAHSGMCKEKFWFKEGLTWGAVTSGSNSYRVKPKEFMFSSGAPSIFTGEFKMDLSVLAFLNSRVSEYLSKIINPTLNQNVNDVLCLPYCGEKPQASKIAKQCIAISRADWDAFETSWDFQSHPLVRCAAFSMQEMAEDAKRHIQDMNYVEEAFVRWGNECYLRFEQLKANEEELNRIFIDIYGLQDELTPEVDDKDVTVRKADLGRDIRSLLSYAVGCMFGRYSLDVEGLTYAGGAWDPSKYSAFLPDADGILPITDEEYLEDDIVSLLCKWLKTVYGEHTLEENLDFIAKALGNKGATSREVIRNYFLKDFFADHCKIYQKRPIYWLFDSGKQNGFKALIYLHRYTPDTIGNLRVDYLHRLQRIYESEIDRMQDMIDHSKNPREASNAAKRKEKLQKQLKECRDYDGKIGHLALSRIELDLDDGVKVNYRKVQTASDGKLYEVLADSRNIMGKK